MPFVLSKGSGSNDSKSESARGAANVPRRRSSSIKQAFTNMMRSGSSDSGNATRNSGNHNYAGSSSVPNSRSGPSSVYNPLVAMGGLPHVFYNSDDFGVARNEQALAESFRPVFNDDECEEADVESDGNMSEAEDLHSYLGSSVPRQPQLLHSGQRYLLEYLTERGFLEPKHLACNKGISMFVATSSEVIFLPTTSSSQEDEYLNHLALLNGTEASLEEPALPQASAAQTSTESQVTGSTETVNGPPLDADGKNVLFNIAVVLSFKKATVVSAVKAELYSRIRVYWQHGVPPEKAHNEEYYTLGELKWELSSQNFNLYVPHHLSTKNKIIEQPESITKPVVFKINNDLSNQQYLDRKKTETLLCSSLESLGNSQTFQPGEYVFLLPTFFSNSIPETVYLPSGRVSYNFRCATKALGSNQSNTDSRSDASSSNSGISHGSEDQHPEPSSHLKFSGNKLLRKVKGQFQSSSNENDALDKKNILRGDHPIQVVRVPPVISESTADKPIYINRVWNDALSYEVSLLKKYVPIGSEVPIKIKLAPISKKVSIKRIRVGVLEKITYVSKNLEYEFDQTEALANDPYNPYYSEFVCRRKQERILSLWEIRTKEKGSRAMREDIIENCRSENIFSYASCPSSGKNGEPVDIVDPLTIHSTLKFPKYAVLDKRTSKNVPPYGIDEFTSTHSPCSGQSATAPRRNSAASGVIGFLSGRRTSTHFRSRHNSLVTGPEPNGSRTLFKSSSDVEVQSHSRINEPKRGLYLDCVSMKNIHVKHKLEIMLRISKPDAKNPSVEKHYEVLIDTPIFIVSDLCGSSNIELPTYDMAVRENTTEEFLPPTFEEAVSVPGSPLASPLNSPMGSPNLVASYDPDELSIQQLSLSRSTTYNNSNNAETSAPAVPGSAGRRYSNIDSLMNQRKNDQEQPIFRKDYRLGNRDISAFEGSALSDGDEPPDYEESKQNT
ncbi:LAQU0S03e03950g1_1 [Lachancea quebecensis]|uniref:LAQU0S03e03950g1_1 n=1 Tax=Lachancea quebecensis TaxID=1654605 RepID=A0A0P1KNP0_9SACH|nr:LAQU0S03e03950g1_1 [Lachancea quebecensis]